MTSPADDPRSVPELFKAALKGEDDAAWEAVSALHYRGTREVLDKAVQLTRSADPATRARAADILGQLGVPERSFPDLCFDAVLPLLRDESWEVIFAAIFSLAQLDRLCAAPHIIPFSDHSESQIRYAVAFALGGVDTPETNRVLLNQMEDEDAEVRNWATFGLAQLSDEDSAELREVFASRLNDPDYNVRFEACIGLGRRSDRRAIYFLEFMLQEFPDDDDTLATTAEFLGLDYDPTRKAEELLGALRKSQHRSGSSP